jgi:hypothetical protein
MLGLMLTDALCDKLLHLIKKTGRVYDKPVHRKTLESILYRLRPGIPSEIYLKCSGIGVRFS